MVIFNLQQVTSQTSLALWHSNLSLDFTRYFAHYSICLSYTDGYAGTVSYQNHQFVRNGKGAFIPQHDFVSLCILVALQERRQQVVWSWAMRWMQRSGCLLFHWKCGRSSLRILSHPITNCVSSEQLKCATSCDLRNKAQSFGL